MSRRPAYQEFNSGPSQFDKITTLGSGQSTTSSHTAGPRFTGYEATSGVIRRKPQGGFIAPLPYSFESRKTMSHLGVRTDERYRTSNPNDQQSRSTTQYIGAYGPSHGDNVFGPFGVDISTDRLRDIALTQARLKMKTGDINLGIAFAERGRTAELVATTASSLTNSYRALRRGDWKRAWRYLGANGHKPTARTVPRRWLEMQYGWQPLLSDVYGSVDALTRRPPSDWRVTGIGVAREQFDRRGTFQSSRTRADVRVTGWKGVHCRIDAIPSSIWKDLSDLGITNPALVGWELVPFSFVVDWFLPIGDYLSGLDAMLGYDDVYYCESRFVKRMSRAKETAGILSQSSYTTRIVSVHSTPKVDDYVSLKRTTARSVPFPVLPRLKNPVSLTRMANALSLLAVTFGNRRR